MPETTVPLTERADVRSAQVGEGRTPHYIAGGSFQLKTLCKRLASRVLSDCDMAKMKRRHCKACTKAAGEIAAMKEATPDVHEHISSLGAYTAVICAEATRGCEPTLERSGDRADIPDDGDVMVVEPERAVAVVVDGRPYAITEERGDCFGEPVFPELDEPVRRVADGRYTTAADVAEAIARQLGFRLEPRHTAAMGETAQSKQERTADIEARVLALDADERRPATMFDPELTYYGDGTAVAVRGDGKTGTTFGVVPGEPYAYQAVRWADGSADAVAPHILHRADSAPRQDEERFTVMYETCRLFPGYDEDRITVSRIGHSAALLYVALPHEAGRSVRTTLAALGWNLIGELEYVPGINVQRGKVGRTTPADTSEAAALRGAVVREVVARVAAHADYSQADHFHPVLSLDGGRYPIGWTFRIVSGNAPCYGWVTTLGRLIDRTGFSAREDAERTLLQLHIDGADAPSDPEPMEFIATASADDLGLLSAGFRQADPAARLAKGAERLNAVRAAGKAANGNPRTRL
ncbi:hypothetical protein [Streptomyces qinglanensis]|uniref:hypothetical protein n=1 Tax=Streptomyces qinglanensis TaxID=943816 RepID=UPI003D73DB3B